MSQGSGSGPGDHPGVTIVELTSDVNKTADALTKAYSAGGRFQFKYFDSGKEFAVLVTPY